MTIWWCEEHKASEYRIGSPARVCCLVYHPLFDIDVDLPCRMVEMDLVLPGSS